MKTKKNQYNTTQHQFDQNKRRKETYEQIKDYLNANFLKWRQEKEKKKRQKDNQNNKVFNQEYEHKSLGFQDVIIKSYHVIHTSTQHQLDNNIHFPLNHNKIQEYDEFFL